MNNDVTVTVTADRLSIRFRDFLAADSYALFLKAKAIPESACAFDPEDESYVLSAPARFAPMLGLAVPRPERGALALHSALLDDQRAIVPLILDAKRFAYWGNCGLGKTFVGLEVARHVLHRTGGPALVITMNEIVNGWVKEAAHFYGADLSVERLKSRDHLRGFCREGGPRLAVTNYEKMNPEDLDRQVVSEMKNLSLIVLDESNRLAMGGGKQKWAIIKSCKGIEYKLSLTATPAPNDVMEFASQASFLEKMRSQEEIIWTYFVRDPKSHRWTVKPHARKAFFDFMSGWSIYVDDPKRYGWRLDQPDVPAPEIFVHRLDMTEQQRAYMAEFTVDDDGQRQLVQNKDTNTVQRGKLSQAAKGFVYLKDDGRRDDLALAHQRHAADLAELGVADAPAAPARRRRAAPAAGKQAVRYLDSLKPAFVADLIRREVEAGLLVLVWTVFDEESKILARLMNAIPALAGRFEMLTGATKEEDRPPIVERFQSGETPVLVSRASMLGFGLNFQCCGSMIFSGFSDSYVQYYQAWHRAVRFKQTRRVRIHLTCVTDLEEDMLDNLFRKEGKHRAEIEEMEANYLKAQRRLKETA